MSYECKTKYANGANLYASDFSFIPIRKNMFFSLMDINNLEYPYQSFIQILIRNPLNHSLRLVKGLTVYAQQDISLTDLQTTKYRINEHTEFIDAYTSYYFTYGTSETQKKKFCLNLTKHQEHEYKTLHKKFHIPFDVSKFTETDRNFLMLLNLE